MSGAISAITHCTIAIMSDSENYLGVDGCRAGWFVVRIRAGAVPIVETMLLGDFAAVLALRPSPRFVAVDMPVGLLTTANPGGRRCDQEARSLLGPRRSSVFSPPLRGHLSATEWSEVSGISKQSFNLLPKIREVDNSMTASRQQRIRETHPELAFCNLNGAPMTFPKRTIQGQRERLKVLQMAVGDVEKVYRDALAQFRRSQVARDDILDALVLAVVAKGMAAGSARRLPRRPSRDSRGLFMEIWS